MVVLCRSNTLSRLFDEGLMWARIPYTLVGDVGFYWRAASNDALALLRLTSTPPDRRANVAFRRTINTPPRGFGPKALTILEQEADWRQVSLLQVIETARLPPKTRAAGLAFSGDANLRRCRKQDDTKPTLPGHSTRLTEDGPRVMSFTGSRSEPAQARTTPMARYSDPTARRTHSSV